MYSGLKSRQAGSAELHHGSPSGVPVENSQERTTTTVWPNPRLLDTSTMLRGASLILTKPAGQDQEKGARRQMKEGKIGAPVLTSAVPSVQIQKTPFPHPGPPDWLAESLTSRSREGVRRATATIQLYHGRKCLAAGGQRGTLFSPRRQAARKGEHGRTPHLPRHVQERPEKIKVLFTSSKRPDKQQCIFFAFLCIGSLEFGWYRCF